ncbi:outer membrane beta-barrel family protein [Belliella sp. DSM 111904]|uniref:Outer membrane beta-barrel family protein n=1 Tax=Belliella filtrata TaxID=2923435 RepID=A0ABS9V0B6_9BACT|nr:outer membrane beta-barrel family protein [Belliella filtrata]MCH7409865.1 outer membrane beta-barrel family protein [Belliella filtrata]
MLSLVVSTTNAQSIISGTLKLVDNEQSAFGINILIKNPSSMTTIAYGITNEFGQFEINVNADTDSLLVLFRSLSVQERKLMIVNETQVISLTLEEGVQEIPEFTLKSIKNPVTLKNDTLSFAVDGFSSPNDRVIADIIKKLPGIEVLDNGKIMYEGRGIQKFYIDGMDLLEGKYNLANKNLPSDAVESIQILENHQPLRVLDSLVFSDRASLNLKLKKKNVWVGTGTAGIGISPLMYEGKFSPMTFRKDLQMLYNVQSNNSGKDIAQELNVLTLEDLQENAGAQESFKPWFGAPALWTPAIKTERFLFNQSQLVSANVLKRNQEGRDFRTNISYLHDHHRQEGALTTAYFLPNDTIQILEGHANRLLTRELDAELSWIRNERKSYFKNRLNLNLINNREIGTSQWNGKSWHQNAELPLFSISNSFHTLKPIGKQLLNIKSDIGFRNAKQNFILSPGSFESILNQGLPFDGLNQEIDYQSLFAHHSVGITKGLPKSWSYTGNLGLLYEFSGMGSILQTFLNNEEETVAEPFLNDLNYKQLKTYLHSQINHKQDNYNIQFKFPISHVNIAVNDNLLKENREVSRFVIEPQLFMKYFLSGKWNTTLRLSRKNDFKGINDIHYGFIIRNFRTFQQKSNSVPEVLSHSLNYGLNFRDPINSIFSSLNYNYVDSKLNTIMESEVDASGEVFYRTLDLNNRGENHLLNLRISKYLSLFKTNLTLTSSYQKNTIEQFINRVLSKVQYEMVGTGVELQINPGKKANFSNKTNLNFVTSQIDSRSTGKIQQWTSLSSLDLFLLENHILTIKWEHYDNRMTNKRDLTGFIDFVYLLKFKNSNWDLSLHGQNILNNNNFETFSADSFYIRQQSFLLRPRQVLLSINFSF